MALGCLLAYECDFGCILGSFWAYRRRMASMMHICSGLVGPKSGNVEKVFVFEASLKGQESHGEVKTGCNGAGRTAWRERKRQKKRFLTRSGNHDAYMFGLGGAQKRKC